MTKESGRLPASRSPRHSAEPEGWLLAYTQSTGNYPGYVSINCDDAGNVTVTVRAVATARQIYDGIPEAVEVSPGDQASITIPASEPEAKALTAIAKATGAA